MTFQQTGKAVMQSLGPFRSLIWLSMIGLGLINIGEDWFTVLMMGSMGAICGLLVGVRIKRSEP